jgi:hypothetical protein
MSQPASFDRPRDGETVLSCKHLTRVQVPLYVGDSNGLGIYVHTQQAGSFWVRWVCLCRWCNAWRRLLRRTPVKAASMRARWQE